MESPERVPQHKGRNALGIKHFVIMSAKSDAGEWKAEEDGSELIGPQSERLSVRGYNTLAGKRKVEKEGSEPMGRAQSERPRVRG